MACAKAWQKNNQLEYQPPIKKAVQQMITSLDEKNRHHLRVLTNTAYFVGKEELAFRKFGSLCGLQEKNGVKMESMYRNEKMCSQFIASIADVEKEKTKREAQQMQELLNKRQCLYVMWTNKDGHGQNFLTLFPLNLQLQMEFVMQLQPAWGKLTLMKKC